MGKKLPDLKHEKELWENGYVVIGIDEVGRGAFAGPLFVGGVIFSPTTNNERITKLLSYGINDSKKLTPHRRELLAEIIQKEALAWHISKIDVPQINRTGIGKSTFCAMRDVVNNLLVKCQLSNVKCRKSPIYVLIDGFYVKYIRGVGLKNQKGIVRGDSISLSIASASIIAKVARDDYMRKLSRKYPEYGWGKNKGYGTERHRSVLKQLGPNRFHRVDFIKF